MNPIEISPPAMTIHNVLAGDHPVFRNPNIIQIDPLRELIRGCLPGHEMPTAKQGFIVEDLDLILRWKGRAFGLDYLGRFRFVEVKHSGFGEFTMGQEYTFIRTILPIMTRGDSEDRFDGLFIVEADKSNTVDSRHGHPVIAPDSKFTVKGPEDEFPMDVAEFLQWCKTPVSPFKGWL